MSDMVDETEQFKKTLAAKGWEIAQRLADLKAGKDFRLSDLDGLELDTINMREKRLRDYLDLVERARTRLRADDGSFGRCIQCGTLLSAGALSDMPWLERCQSCTPRSDA